jgi:hypothetical protein
VTGVTTAATAGDAPTDGPYATTFGDHGPCGQWANDTLTVTYTQGGGANFGFQITTEKDKGHFLAIAGVAPGDLQPNEDASCDPNTADLVNDGVTGTVQASENLIVQGPYSAGDGTCNGSGGSTPCDRSTYLAYHYPNSGGAYTEAAYKWTYRIPKSGTLSNAIRNDKAWIEICPTTCANNGYDDQNYSKGNITSVER